MKNSNSAGRDLLLLLIGIGMCVGGLYLFASKVSVSPNMSRVDFFGMLGGNGVPGGMIIIPLILGIVLWIAVPKTYIGQILTAIGALIIVLGVISSLNLRMREMNLFELITIMVLIFGGAALSLRMLLTPTHKD